MQAAQVRFAANALGKDNMLTKRLRTSAALAFSLAMASSASAYSYWQGKAGQIFFSQPGNYPFRVYANSATPLSGCPGNFAYIETSNPNYQVYVSSITTAFTTGKTLHLTYGTD